MIMIVIDAMLKQLRAKGEINIASFLSHIRHQRAFLVQTEDQFRLIHDTLGESFRQWADILWLPSTHGVDSNAMPFLNLQTN